MARCTLVLLLLSGCSASLEAGGGDAAAPTDGAIADRATVLDGASVDLRAPAPSDAALDLASPVEDLAVALDEAAGDLTQVRDLAPTNDFNPVEDLVAAADRAAPADQASAPADLAHPADMAGAVRFSFTAFADNQFATTSCTSGVPERLAVPLAMAKLSPTFMVEAGDLMDHGYESGAYAQFESCYSSTVNKAVFFPSPGNHDQGSGGITAFKKFLESRLNVDNPKIFGSAYASTFRIAYEDDKTAYSTDPSHPTMTNIVPSGFTFKTFYAFRYKNAYFLSFEQGTRWWTNTPKTWVEKHLKAARADPSIEHVFVVMHHPLYSTTMAESGTGEAIGPVRAAYESLFRQYDVTAVFAGHVHLFEHFYVPDSGAASRSSGRATYPHDGKGVHYLIHGGAGGPLPGCSPMPGERAEKSRDYTQARGCGYHFVQVVVEGRKLTFKVIGVKGSSSSYTTSTWNTFTVE